MDGSEREKRRYFRDRLGDRLRDDEYPRLVFGKKPNVTVRYFSDKLPIGYERDHYRHVFTYLARSPSPMDFRVFILRHLELLNALGFWTSPDAQRFLWAGPQAQRTAQVPITVVLNWQEELKQRMPTK